MNGKFAEFLFNRIATKLGYITDSSSSEELTAHIDDIEDYLSALKDIFKEVITP